MAIDPKRIRLYIDESGDHTFQAESHSQVTKRHLCLLGCAIAEEHYLKSFVPGLNAIKGKYLGAHPDDPVVLHRLDLCKRAGVFKVLRDQATAQAFDADLLALLSATEFRVFAVLVDKMNTRTKQFGPLPS